ncbi:MAG: cysteine--tRNA ligase [Clostridia bacterium]
MLKLYNTITKNKEKFEPINKNEVKIYTCGPTVYNFAHIGNLRAYIFMDNLRKVLKYNGYNLNHVMNITDVGHLVSDADEGEDKMAKSAKEQNLSVYEIARMYTQAFLEDIEKINIEKVEHIVKATDHIKEMEQYVKEIVDNGYAYETSKGVYFDTKKLLTYGELSNVNKDGQMAGARIDIDNEKKDPLDFALWIKAPKEHIMKWDSKWGMCYPGWHIECSAMSRKYLGEKFDIHTGGVDHISIHHENEIAQARGATGLNPANLWMHVEFLLINGGKMSKSLKNVYTLNDLEKHKIQPLAYRYFTYTSHYRNKLNFTWDAINAAQVSLSRLREATLQHKDIDNIIDDKKIDKIRNTFLNALNDDINLPLAMSIVWEVAREKIKSHKYYLLLIEFDKVLSLDLDKENENIKIPDNIQELLMQRKIARDNKEYILSDTLRDKIKDFGYIVLDSKDGQKLEKV